MTDIDLASVPGNCFLTHYGSTMGEILGFDGERLNPDRVIIFREAVAGRIKSLLHGELIADPIKMFIKQEPHKLSKIKEGRQRLISAVSIIDTTVDRMIFQDLFSYILQRPLSTPVAVGWAPTKLGAGFLKCKLPGKTFDTDKKHWDWTFPYWLLYDCYVTLLSVGVRPEWQIKLAMARFKMLFELAVFSFPDGSQVKQLFQGIQKSGCYLTLILNSMGQWFLHRLAELALGIEVPMVCFGDDVTQDSTDFDEDFAAFYEALGFKLETSCNDVMEFCGFKIHSCSRFIPCYRDKHVFMLRHLTLDDEIAIQTIRSYQYIYWFDKPFLAFLRDVAYLRNLPQALVDDADIMRVIFDR